MAFPKHVKVPGNRIMQAPYNFVPLPEAVLAVDYKIPEHDFYNDNLCIHTGYIDLEIETGLRIHCSGEWIRCFCSLQCH